MSAKQPGLSVSSRHGILAICYVIVKSLFVICFIEMTSYHGCMVVQAAVMVTTME